MKYKTFEMPSAWQWYIKHPLGFLKDVNRNIVWMFQRIFRGWDNRVTWALDDYLNEMIPTWLEKLIEDKQGVPSMMFSPEDYLDDGGTLKEGVLERGEQEYNEILRKIIVGFKANTKMHDIEIITKEQYLEEYSRLEAIFDEGMHLFNKYYNTLAD
jgi:hypothetical protein